MKYFWIAPLLLLLGCAAPLAAQTHEQDRYPYGYGPTYDPRYSYHAPKYYYPYYSNYGSPYYRAYAYRPSYTYRPSSSRSYRNAYRGAYTAPTYRGHYPHSGRGYGRR